METTTSVSDSNTKERSRKLIATSRTRTLFSKEEIVLHNIMLECIREYEYGFYEFIFYEIDIYKLLAYNFLFVKIKFVSLFLRS